MDVLRVVALWVFGLLASGIFGGMIGSRFGSEYSDYGVWGFLCGVFAFACARLWFGGSRT
jgi:hypothetical protein